MLRLADTNDDSKPDYVYVTVSPTTTNQSVNPDFAPYVDTTDNVTIGAGNATNALEATAQGYVYVLNAANLTPAPLPAWVDRSGTHHDYDGLRYPTQEGSATGLGVSRNATEPTFIVTTQASPTDPDLAGTVTAFGIKSGIVAWERTPDVRGKYIVEKQIPKNWLFGPYVVECTVTWTDHVLDSSSGTAVAKDVLQEARFYDYFVVTPPNSLVSPSPLYDISLVTWMDDWR
jgi:hypothetical protein